MAAKHRRKKPEKRKPQSKYNDQLITSTISSIEQIELEPNASKFAVFSAVRSSVLESETKYSHLYGCNQDESNNFIGSHSVKVHPVACCCHCAPACKSGAFVECRCHTSSATAVGNVGRIKSPDIDSDAETYISEDTTDKDVMLQIPQIVGAGLRGLFDLIAEARSVSPTLCTKALKSLFDVIQGQIPESFKNEPTDLIDPLYDLLLDLTTLHGPASVHNNDTNNWSAIGCSALLGLCVARGDTGKTLKAIAALLMSSKILANQNVQLPLVLNTLQRSIYCVALGKPTKPDYYKNGIPKNSKILQFSLKNQLPANIQYHLQPSIASNGRYIFILTSKTLLKIGTGFNGTLRGYVYAVNNEFGKDKMGWIGFCGDILFYKKISKRNTESILIVNTETLNIMSAAQVIIPPTKDGQNCLLFSDGESLNAICTTNDVILCDFLRAFIQLLIIFYVNLGYAGGKTNSYNKWKYNLRSCAEIGTKII